MGFIGGALQGYAGTALKRKQAGQGGLIGKLKDKMADKGRSRTVNPPLNPGTRDVSDPSSYKRGGKVKKGGYGKLHKGERVLTKGQQKRMKRGRGRRGQSAKR